MKRYIKSFTADQLKQQLGDNYPEGGYLYIFKHGIGPGTIPKDVQVVKTKDLPNYYTAVWLDRFLTTPELKQYDIPDETRINELLGRINYCQKDGDVVPCDDVEACGDIKASSNSKNDDVIYKIARVLSQNSIYDIDDWIEVAKSEVGTIYASTVKSILRVFIADSLSAAGYNFSDESIDKECNKILRKAGVDDVEACDKVTASRTINRWNHDIEEYEPVEIPDDWNVTTYSSDMDEEVNCVHCGKPLPFGESYCSRRYHDRYGFGYAECEDCYEEQLKDEFGNKDVNACDNVMASEICYRDRDNDDRVVALDVGMSDEDVEEMLAAHPSYYRSTLDEIDTTTEPKYFANMVSASEHPNTYGYMVSGYYDSDRRGLAESEWTGDLSTVDELANEYANKGYYIVVNNFETGTVLEFSADNWFDEIYPDGLSGVEGLI